MPAASQHIFDRCVDAARAEIQQQQASLLPRPDAASFVPLLPQVMHLWLVHSRHEEQALQMLNIQARRLWRALAEQHPPQPSWIELIADDRDRLRNEVAVIIRCCRDFLLQKREQQRQQQQVFQEQNEQQRQQQIVSLRARLSAPR